MVDEMARRRDNAFKQLEQIANSGKRGSKEARGLLDHVRDDFVFTHEMEAELDHLINWINKKP